jgi:phage terminase large subunit-like protein
VLQDLVSYRDAPGAIEAAIVRQAQEDGPRVLVGLWVDPAQAGLDQAQRMKKILNRKGFGVVLGPQVKSKREYATLPSQLAYSGELWVVGDDLEWAVFFNEIEAFPPALGMPMSKRPHDDCVDVLSGVVMDLDTHRVNPTAWDSDIRDPNRSVDNRFFYGDPEEEEGDEL